MNFLKLKFFWNLNFLIIIIDFLKLNFFWNLNFLEKQLLDLKNLLLFSSSETFYYFWN